MTRKCDISGPPPPVIRWAVYQQDIDRVRVGFVKNNYSAIITQVSDTEFKGSCNVPFVSANKVISTKYTARLVSIITWWFKQSQSFPVLHIKMSLRHYLLLPVRPVPASPGPLSGAGTWDMEPLTSQSSQWSVSWLSYSERRVSWLRCKYLQVTLCKLRGLESDQ